MDADIRFGPNTLTTLINHLNKNDQLDLVGAAPALTHNFQPETFWHSVFALPYYAIEPANSLAGGLYAARQECLETMPEDVINEDLYLSLKHESRFSIVSDATFFVSPPKNFSSFLNKESVSCIQTTKNKNALPIEA